MTEPSTYAGVDPHAGALGHTEAVQRAGGGQEAGRHVLGVEPGLDGVAGEGGAHRLRGQRPPGGDLQLEIDQIEPGDQLGDRVLDLQAGVDLEERRSGRRAPARTRRCRRRRNRWPEPPRTAASHMRGARRASSTAGDGASSMIFWWRRWMEHSRSNRWTTVPWASPKIWTSTWRGERRRSARGTRCRRRRRRPPPARPRRPRRASSAAVAHHPHAAPAAAVGRLDQHRVADPAGRRRQLAGRRRRAHRHARQDRDAGAGHQPLGLDLGAHDLDGVAGAGPTKTRPASAQARAKSAFSDRNP